jgi:hypothetical protein
MRRRWSDRSSRRVRTLVTQLARLRLVRESGRMRADIHDGPEQTLQSKAGYSNARPHQQSRRNLLHRTAGPYRWVSQRHRASLTATAELASIADRRQGVARPSTVGITPATGAPQRPDATAAGRRLDRANSSLVRRSKLKGRQPRRPRMVREELYSARHPPAGDSGSGRGQIRRKDVNAGHPFPGP